MHHVDEVVGQTQLLQMHTRSDTLHACDPIVTEVQLHQSRGEAGATIPYDDTAMELVKSEVNLQYAWK